MKKCFLTLFIFSGIFLANTASAFSISINETLDTISLTDCTQVQAYVYAENGGADESGVCDVVWNYTSLNPLNETYQIINNSSVCFDNDLIREDCLPLSINNILLYYYSGEWHTAPSVSGVNPSIENFSVITPLSATEMIAGLGTGVKDTGVNLWVIVALAIAIPLGFWLFEKVTEVFPSDTYTQATTKNKNFIAGEKAKNKNL